jgi:hypothetical protein
VEHAPRRRRVRDRELPLLEQARSGHERAARFGVCANDELHGDVEYYVVAWEQHGVRITAHAMEHDAGEVRLGKAVRSAVCTPPARKEETPSATFSTLLLPQE